MFSTNTFAITPAVQSAPTSCVRRKQSSRPPIASIHPANIVYGRLAPMKVHIRPIGDESPYSCSSRCMPGSGNCRPKILLMP